jgi:hypothetical protein
LRTARIRTTGCSVATGALSRARSVCAAFIGATFISAAQPSRAAAGNRLAKIAGSGLACGKAQQHQRRDAQTHLRATHAVVSTSKLLRGHRQMAYALKPREGESDPIPAAEAVAISP